MFEVKYNYNFVKFDITRFLARNYILVNILKKFLFALWITILYTDKVTQATFMLITEVLYFFYLMGVKPWRNTRALNLPIAVLEGIVSVIYLLVLIITASNSTDTK